MRSVMVSQHDFSKIPGPSIQRSVFDRSHGHKTTFNSGYLIPVLVDEVLPGDTFSCNLTALCRLQSPLKYPLMDNMFFDTFFFAVPLRLLWSHFKNFMGEQTTTDPVGATDYTIPQVISPVSTGFAIGSLYDYLGVPVGVPSLSISALFPRAYALIYQEWFRDQNLVEPIHFDNGDGPETELATPLYALQKRGKRHDYFTSCLPWPQKGDAVLLPLSGTANVYGNGNQITFTEFANTPSLIQNMQVVNSGVGLWTDDHALTAGSIAFGSVVGFPTKAQVDGASTTGVTPTSALYADLSTAVAASINDLREAFQVQKLLERDARGGTRYTEIIRAHFGVISPDARLQRPEYLGGSSTPINLSVVQQTSATGAGDTAQGNLSSFAHGHSSGSGFSKSFTEHCILIALVNVRCDLTYQQGLHRMFTRQSRYDFYWPEFAHLGEQTVLNREIYCQGPGATHTVDGVTSIYDDEAFGYQERYAEYRYKPSLVTGEFRTYSAPGVENSNKLDTWHLSQSYDSLPFLNQDFIEDNSVDLIDRVSAVSHNLADQFCCDMFFSYKCARPMPAYSVPGFIDHF
jgi:hypothetical protein